MRIVQFNGRVGLAKANGPTGCSQRQANEGER
jgi:hypothetical protein